MHTAPESSHAARLLLKRHEIDASHTGVPVEETRTPEARAEAAPLRTSLWLDSTDTISAVDEAWLEFARRNAAPELNLESVVGRPLGAFITGPEVQQLTVALTAAARRRASPLDVPFRCDSPGVRRFMTMTLRAETRGSLHLEYRVDQEDRRPDVPLLDRHAPRSEKIVVICSWCRRVRQGSLWQDADQAIALGGLFGPSDQVPLLSHGICDRCAADVRVAMRSG